MIIGVDIDDTLTNTFDYILPYVAEYFGVSEQELREWKISYNNLPDKWKSEEINFCKAYFDRVIEDTPFKPDAARGINCLRALGHKIVIITLRTEDFYTDPYDTTVKELSNGEIVYDKLICTLDKVSACAAEGVSLFIDDTLANCAAVSQALGIPVLVMNSKANEDIETNFLRVSDWEEVVEYIVSSEFTEDM